MVKIGFSVKIATAEDAEAVWELVLEHALFQGGAREDLTLSKERLAQHIRDGVCRVLLAKSSEGAAVGELLFCDRYSGSDGRALHVEDLFVKPDARRSGVGRALWTNFEALAAEAKVSRLNWQCLSWNQPAVAFYASVGGLDCSALHQLFGCRLSGAELGALAEATMPQGFTVQPLEPTDDASMVALLAMRQRLYSEELGLDRELRLGREEWAADLREGRAAVELLKDAEDCVVGFTMACGLYSSWQGPFLWLEDLYVRPEARGKGVGKALMGRLARKCVSEGLPRLQWETIKGIPVVEFYKRLGAKNLLETQSIVQMIKKL